MRRPLPGSKGWKIAAAVGVTVALFVPLMALGGPAFARTGAAAHEYGHASASQYEYRVTVCHRTHARENAWVQITISSHALRAHERHGDVLPPCPPAPPAGKHHDRPGGQQSGVGGRGGDGAPPSTTPGGTQTATTAQTGGAVGSGGDAHDSGSASNTIVQHATGSGHGGDHGQVGGTGGQGGGDRGGHGRP